MSSPVSADTCCVCFKSIQPGDHARDSEGEWDVHKGECAEKAGVGRITIGGIRDSLRKTDRPAPVFGMED